MKKINILLMFYAILGACFMNSCTTDESFVNQGKEGINFTTASEHYAFGALPLNKKNIQVKVVLEKTGFVSTDNKHYSLSIDTTLTNVRWGFEAEKPDLERVWKAGLWHDTLLININRSALSFEKTYKIVLRISNKGALPTSVSELSTHTITFNNQLEKPLWWSELTGSTLTIEEIKDHQYEILRTFKRIKSFFNEHPYEGIIFPSVTWPV